MANVIITSDNQAAPDIDPRLDMLLQRVLVGGETQADWEQAAKMRAEIEAAHPGYDFRVEICARRNEILISCPLLSKDYGIYVHLRNAQNDPKLVFTQVDEMLERFKVSRAKLREHEIAGRRDFGGNLAFDSDKIQVGRAKVSAQMKAAYSMLK